MFSRRTNWELKLNPLALSLQKIRQQGDPILDLTESNPTHCHFRYLSKELLTPLIDPANLRYDPSPKGALKARESIADFYFRKGVHVHPDQIFLTSSTSEAYSFLFRLLCDPNDHLLVPQPSYPLLDYLTVLDDLIPDSYRLLYNNGWQVNVTVLKKLIHSRTRGILMVNPNNPTGSFIKEKELSVMDQLAHEHSLALISDEVFADYIFLENSSRIKSIANHKASLSFTLGGISKSLGLPQMKLSWLIASGPSQLRDSAVSRLEVISDTYLSPNIPAQNALGEWLKLTTLIQQEIQERIRCNREFLLQRCEEMDDLEYLISEGGWYAILRISSIMDEEKFVLALLEKDHVWAHPGYFFDLEGESHIVLSLLPDPNVFKEGVERIIARVKD